MDNQRVTLKEQAAAIRSKQKAQSDLIAALLQYRESARASGRPAMWGWADDKLRQLGASVSHVSEDLQLHDAISAFHNSRVVPAHVSEDLMREFRSTLRDDELESLLDVVTTIAAA